MGEQVSRQADKEAGNWLSSWPTLAVFLLPL